MTVSATWNAGATGYWSTQSDWTNLPVEQYPGQAAADSVTLGADNYGAYTVTDDISSLTLGSLTLRASNHSGYTTTLFLDASSPATLSAPTISVGSQAKIDGAGTLSASGKITGPGTIAAGSANTGGTLDITGAGSISGVVLQIGSAAATTLEIGMAGSSSAISINNAKQTLEIASGGALTITAAESITAGTIQMAGGSLTDTSGVTVGAGATLSGCGTVTGPVSGTGTIDAAGGTLTLASNLSATNLEASGGATLALGGTVAPGTQFTFANSGGAQTGTLVLGANSLASFESNATINGMNVETGGTGAPWGDVIDIQGLAFGSVASGEIVNGNTLELLNSNSAVVAHFKLGSDPSPFVNYANDGTGGTVVSLDSVVCYVAGTRILTDRGEIAVENLRVGDLAVVVDGEARSLRPVRWMGRRRIDLTAHPRPTTVAPIRISAGAFTEQLPKRDLMLSPDHAIFVDGVLIAARQLVNGMTIVQETGWAAVEYFHVELEEHAILLAEGLPAESYLDTGNRSFFANAGLPLTLHPDLSEDRSELSRAAGACAPFVVDEAAVRPVWQSLAERAVALGYAVPGFATTADPALRIVSKGRTIEPIHGRDGLYIFPLPLGATGARIVSRAASPAATRPWLDDRRELGVSVARIVLRTASDTTEIAVDHPDLIEGWWDTERESVSRMHRWTDGNALLTLPALKGHCMLELHLNGTMTYPVGAPAIAEPQRRAG